MLRSGFLTIFTRVAACMVLGTLGVASTAAADPPAVILATTTSTQDTGLLDVLVPAFERASGSTVKVIAVGTGAALAMGTRGDADVLLVHAPDAEQRYMASGRGRDRMAVMHNAFILVGPAADPAHAHGSASAAEAFARIAKSSAPFVSRADDSGTDKKEHVLWQAAGTQPSATAYVKTGSGMADTLHVASQKHAYTLTDDGTFLSQRATLDLVPLVDGSADLANPYHVIVVVPIAGHVANPAGGEAFARYVVSPAGQAVIASFGRERYGRPLFVPDASAH